MLNSLEAPVYIERVALGNNKQIMHAAKVVKRAVENQVKGLGFSFVEVLSPCPTIWKMQPLEAQRFVQDEMASRIRTVQSPRPHQRCTGAPHGRRSPGVGRPAASPRPGERRGR